MVVLLEQFRRGVERLHRGAVNRKGELDVRRLPVRMEGLRRLALEDVLMWVVE